MVFTNCGSCMVTQKSHPPACTSAPDHGQALTWPPGPPGQDVPGNENKVFRSRFRKWNLTHQATLPFLYLITMLPWHLAVKSRDLLYHVDDENLEERKKFRQKISSWSESFWEARIHWTVPTHEPDCQGGFHSLQWSWKHPPAIAVIFPRHCSLFKKASGCTWNCGRSSELSLVFSSWVCGTQAAARRTTLKNLELTKAERDWGGVKRRERRGRRPASCSDGCFRRHSTHPIYQQNMVSWIHCGFLTKSKLSSFYW